MNIRVLSIVVILSLFGFGCATKAPEVDTKVEAEQKVEPVTKEAPADLAKEPVDTTTAEQDGFSTDSVHPYKRSDGEQKSIDVQIVKPNGEPTVTDSADPNLASGGGANMGVTLMSKKQATISTADIRVSTAPPTAQQKGKTPTGVPAEKALGWLKNGNTRFVKGTVRRDGQSAKDRKRVAQKATPHAFVVACSESIAPPELVFDQKLGEIDVARNLGAGIDDSVVRAMEDSVQHGTHLVIILDHSGCSSKTDHHDAANEIAAKSTMLDALIKSGALTIKTAIYDQDNGRVSF